MITLRNMGQAQRFQLKLLSPLIHASVAIAAKDEEDLLPKQRKKKPRRGKPSNAVIPSAEKIIPSALPFSQTTFRVKWLRRPKSFLFPLFLHPSYEDALIHLPYYSFSPSPFSPICVFAPLLRYPSSFSCVIPVATSHSSTPEKKKRFFCLLHSLLSPRFQLGVGQKGIARQPGHRGIHRASFPLRKRTVRISADRGREKGIRRANAGRSRCMRGFDSTGSAGKRKGMEAGPHSYRVRDRMAYLLRAAGEGLLLLAL